MHDIIERSFSSQ